MYELHILYPKYIEIFVSRIIWLKISFCSIDIIYRNIFSLNPCTTRPFFIAVYLVNRTLGPWIQYRTRSDLVGSDEKIIITPSLIIIHLISTKGLNFTRVSDWWSWDGIKWPRLVLQVLTSNKSKYTFDSIYFHRSSIKNQYIIFLSKALTWETSRFLTFLHYTWQ